MSKQKGKEKPGNIFDAFVKNMLGRIFVFVDFLIYYANKDFVSSIDLTRVRPAPTHYIGQVGDERITDLVFQCPMKNGKGNRLAIIIFEHQSGSLRHIPLKLLKYISAIWDAEMKAGKPLSVPYFIVLRTGKKPHRGPTPRISDLFRKYFNGQSFGSVVEIEYDLIDLPAWDFKKLVGGPVLRAVLGILKNMTEGMEEEFPESLLPLCELPDDERKNDLTKEFLLFAGKAMQSHNKRLDTQMVKNTLNLVFQEQQRSENMVISIFEEKFLEGVKKGKAEGKAEEKIEGKIETILLILSDHFDGVSKKLEKKVQKITDIEKLNNLIKLAARCESIKEFEKALD